MIPSFKLPKRNSKTKTRRSMLNVNLCYIVSCFVFLFFSIFCCNNYVPQWEIIFAVIRLSVGDFFAVIFYSVGDYFCGHIFLSG